MVPSKPKKDESRRSSILKPYKPRQPLQNVNINSSSNENSPATSKIKRRVSFAEKKHVKEFCHSMEQGTVWDNTYEEHDFSLKGSFAMDQNTKVDSKENTSKVPFENDCIHIGIETSSNHTNSLNSENSQPYISAVKAYEDDNDLNFTNYLPVKHVEMFNQELSLGQTILPNVSESIPDNVTVYTDRDKENCISNIYNEYYPKIYTNEVNPELDKTCIQDVSMEFTTAISTSLIPVYCDMEDNKQEDIRKDNVALHQDNFDTNCTMGMTKVTSWKNKTETFIPASREQENVHKRRDTNNSFTFTEKTKSLLKSMEITEAVSVPLCQERIYDIKHATESLISNCNNQSMEITQAIPVIKEPIKSDKEIFKKVPVIMQNYEDTRCDTPNNSIILPTNLQPTEGIVSRWMQDTNRSNSHLVSDNSIKSTSIIQSLVTDTNGFNMNADGNDAKLNISMEITTALPSKIDEKKTIHFCNKITMDQNTKVDSKENASKVPFEDDSINISIETSSNHTNGPNSKESQLCISAVEVYEDNNDLSFTNPVERVKMFNKELSLGQTVLPNAPENIPDTIKEGNLRKSQEDIEHINKTEFLNDVLMEMTRPINPYEKNTPHLNSEDTIITGKNLRKNRETKENSDETELFNGASMQMTRPINFMLPASVYKKKNLRIDEPTSGDDKNMFSYNTSMEMTKAILSRNKKEMFNPIIHENNKCEKNTNNSMTCSEKTNLLCKSMDITEAVPDPSSHKKIRDVENIPELTEVPVSHIAITPRTHSLRENSAGSQLQTDTIVNNDQAIHASMEMTAAIQSTVHHMNNITLNEMEHFDVSKSNESQCPTVNIVAEFRKHETRENVTIPRDIETTDLHDTSSDIRISTNNFDNFSLNAALTNTNGKRLTHENENTSMKKFRSDSFMESQFFVCDNVYSSSRINDKNVSNKCLIEDKTDPILISALPHELNDNDSVTIPRDTKTTDLHDTSSDIRVSTNNLDNFSLNAALTNANGKRLIHENENTSMKKFCSDSFVESQFFVCDNVRSSSRINDKNVSNKCLVENKTDPIQISALPYELNDNDTVTIPRDTETTDLHNTSSDIRVSINNFDNFSLNAALTNANGKKTTHKNENTSIKKFHSDFFVESQSFVCNNVYSSSKINDKNVSNKCLIEDKTDPIQNSALLCELNDNDSLNKTDESSFLRKNLENSLVELQSINPPSFISMNIEEENSFHELLQEDKLDTSTTTDVVPISNKNNSSERLNPTNIEHDETKDCHRSVVADAIKNNQTTDCQAIEKTIIDDYRVDGSNHHAKDTEHPDEESVLSTSNIKRRKSVKLSSIDHFTETNVTREDPVEEEKHIREKINDEVELRNIEQEEQCSDVEEKEERCVDHMKETQAIIKDQMDQDEYCQQNSDGKVNPQGVEQKQDEEKRLDAEQGINQIEQEEQCSDVEEEEKRCVDHMKETEARIKDQADQDEYCQKNSDGKVNPQSVEQKQDEEKRLDAEQNVNKIEEEEPLVQQHPLLSLLQRLETYAEGKDCIWNVYYKNIDRRMIGFGFMSNSLLIVTFFSNNLYYSEENFIKEVRIISRLADDADVLIKIVHGLILEKISVETLTHFYRTHEDVLSMLDLVSQDVKLAMNFMFDLKRLNNLNLMEIAHDKISFMSRSKHMDIILKITINVKRFDKLTPNDININCLLGTIGEMEVKNLIRGVKKDHKFLRRYMNDVRDYIDIMEEISTTSK